MFLFSCGPLSPVSPADSVLVGHRIRPLDLSLVVNSALSTRRLRAEMESCLSQEGSAGPARTGGICLAVCFSCNRGEIQCRWQEERKLSVTVFKRATI